MGGGAVFRGMARLAGAATAVGAAAVPTTGAFCRAHPPASSSMREQESLSALLNNNAQNHCCDVNTNSKEFGSSVDVRFELEEHDCCFAEKEESSSGATLRRLVFSAPPTEEEVGEATKELHAALHLSIPAGGFQSEEDRLDPIVGLASCDDDVDTATTASDRRGTSTSTPSSQSFNHLGALAAQSSSVMQAFQLLQTNSKVQDAVKSLACDPAVWNAVLSNEKMQELTQEDLDFRGTDTNEEEIMDSDEETLTSKLYGFVTMRTMVYYNLVKGKLLSILNSMFGSMERAIFSKGSSATDKTRASCMMLAVAVLIVVVMRRRHCPKVRVRRRTRRI